MRRAGAAEEKREKPWRLGQRGDYVVQEKEARGSERERERERETRERKKGENRSGDRSDDEASAERKEARFASDFSASPLKNVFLAVVVRSIYPPPPLSGVCGLESKWNHAEGVSENVLGN